MSVTKSVNSLAGAATVQNAATVKQLPKPVAPKKDFFSDFTDFFKDKKIEPLATNPLVKPPKPQTQAPEAPKVEAPKVEPKKGFDPASMMLVQNLLKDTSRSTLDKLKSLLPIPKSLDSIVNMFLGKGTNAGVKVGIENNALNLTVDVKMPGAGIKGTAVLSLPTTAQPPTDAVTELHPIIIEKLSKALNPLLSEKEQIKGLIQLISTLPSEVLRFTWSNGSANITITLPNGASLKLTMKLPTSKESEKTPDILRTLLKSILKENYAGIETLLSKDMVFNWDGSTSRFEIRFPQQLALQIQEISSLDISNPILSKLVTAIGSESELIIPPIIRGTVNFKNPSIQFDKGTKFIIKNAPIPDISIDRISYDPTSEKMFLTLKTSWILFPDALLNNLEIDLKDSPKQAPKKTAVEKPTIVKYKFVPIVTKDVAPPEASVAVAPKSTISAFDCLKQMIKIPKTLEPLLGSFFADQTTLDINIGIEDNLTVSVDNLNIPKLGVTGKASLKIPTQPTQDKMPVTLPKEIEEKIEEIVKRLGGEKLQPEQAVLFYNLFDLALTLPNQNIRMQWEGNIRKATLFITLPGGMELTLELDVKNIPVEHDILRTKLLEVLDNKLVIPKEESPLYYLHTKLSEVLNTVGANDPRRAQIFEVLRTNADKAALRAKLVKMPGTDFLRTKLSEVLGAHFAEIEPFLSQTMNFEWDGENNAVLKLPNLGVTGNATIFFPKKQLAVQDKKTVELHPKIKAALTELMSSDSKSNSADLINLMMTMSNQNIHMNWMGNTNKAALIVTLPGGMGLNLELDMKKIEEKNDILRTKLAEILGDQFAADIEPLLTQTFTFNWDGEKKEFSIKFHKEQNLHIKSLKFKKAVGFFAPLKNLLMKVGEWLTKDRMITLPQEISGNVDFANAKINFDKGTSFFVRTALGTKRAGLRLISFARENWIDIGIKCMGGHLLDIDTRTSDIDKSQIDEARIAIVDRTPNAARVRRDRDPL